MMETWLPAVGYEGIYSVSDRGRVRRVRAAQGAVAGRILRPRVSRDGHSHVNLYTGNVVRDTYVHQLVLTAFAGQCPPGLECRHLDGDLTNNQIENLRWDIHTSHVRSRRDPSTPSKGDE